MLGRREQIGDMGRHNFAQAPVLATSPLHAAVQLWRRALGERAGTWSDVVTQCLELPVMGPLTLKRLDAHVASVAPSRLAWAGQVMGHFWRITNVTFPQVLYSRGGGSLKELSLDPELVCPPVGQFNYTDRLMHAGTLRDRDLLGWFVGRMRDRRFARCPYYWLPFFNTDDAFKEAKPGAKYCLQRRTANGLFCLAGLCMYPHPDKQVAVTLMTRNWASSRWLSNMNGMAYLMAALGRELAPSGWGFHSLTVMAPLVQVDWPKDVLRKLVETGEGLLKEGSETWTQ